MIVDVAHINQAESIFSQDDVHVTGNMDTKMFFAGAGAPLFKAQMENTMDKLAHKDDLNFQGFGNKIVTKEDYDRYKSSLKLFSARQDKVHSPNPSVENIHRL
ncbi:MAG: hypothetical protein IJI14_10960 [Anaerolineaceae bacterium]|nr:hypothetical protein [Anaerolineaceae bacterium]